MKYLIGTYLSVGLLLISIPQIFYLLTLAVSKFADFGLVYKPFLIASAVLLAIWTVIILYGHFIGRFNYEIKEVKYESAQLPEAFDNFRIVHISDLHMDGWDGNEKELDKVINKINSLEADVVCFTGDLVSFYHHEVFPHIESLRKIKAKYGVYSVMGNHDYSPYMKFPSEKHRKESIAQLVDVQKNKLNWNLLMNESKEIKIGDDAISIVGVENQSCGVHRVVRRGDLKKAVNGTDDKFNILLSHDPSHWRAEVLPESKVNLTLSGHTHAMQFKLFGFSPSPIMVHEADYRGFFLLLDRKSVV